jgi:D-alanyl-D-alanine endopeptidase (penicillin-binding protein 7)
MAVLLAMSPASAATKDGEAQAQKQLKAIFDQRTDLQAAFRRSDWLAVSPSKTPGMAELEDWARQYGYMEYPEELIWYSPAYTAGSQAPRALRNVKTAIAPAIKEGSAFDFSSITAEAVMVIDVPSRDVLLSRGAHMPRPAASLTKLMTAIVTLERKVPMGRTVAITSRDEVGGARLRVPTGTKLTVRDLFYAMLIGSANNAANALMRASQLGGSGFIAAMNAKAETMGLRSTKFTDPSGIEVSNVSTAEDIAALALEAFEVYDIRKATTTAQHSIVAARSVHRFKNTDELLVDPDNGLYVLGGKTGYLPEGGWNFVVKMMDSRQKPLLVVVLGSDTMAASFRDAEKVAKWSWDNYRWGKK